MALVVLAAVATFAVVQDRITADGARRYASQVREAAAAGQPPPATVDDSMQPAIAEGVRRGALWGGLVLVIGLTAGAGFQAVRRGSPRRQSAGSRR